MNAKQNRIEALTILISDLIRNEGIDAVLWLKNCWQKQQNIKFNKLSPVPIEMTKNSLEINTIYDDESNKLWIFVDMECNDSAAFLKNVNQSYFAHPFRWIIADANDELEKLNLLPDSNVILVHFDEIQQKYTLKQGKLLKFHGTKAKR